MKKFVYLLEYFCFLFFRFIFSTIGLAKAVSFFKLTVGAVGPYTSFHNRVLKNLAIAFPEHTAKERQGLAKKVWHNFAAMCAECVCFKKSHESRFQVVGYENFETVKNTGAIFINAHIGAWELSGVYCKRNNIELKAIYRPLNNKYVDKVILKDRCITGIEKGAKGMTKLYKMLQNPGCFVGTLIDQRIRGGEVLSFFGTPALTSTVPIRLAQKYSYPIVPMFILREDEVGLYTLHFEKPIIVAKSDDVSAITQRINNVVEGWIRKHPEQWFWLHNRWKI